jgi:hypothetical protein
MTRRPFRFLAAALGCFAVLAVAAPAAHASGPAQADPSASASIVCKPSQKIQWPSFEVHMANSALAQASANFVVMINGFQDFQTVLAPGTTRDQQLQAGWDGLPNHLVVTANNVTVLDQSYTLRCNPLTAEITHQGCEVISGKSMDAFRYSVTNYSNVHDLVVVHEYGGKTYTESNIAQFEFNDFAPNGKAYDVWIDVNGVKKAELTGTANCAQPPTTTTTQPPVTTTTVGSAQVDPPASTPTTAHHATTLAAGQTLPFTGGSSVPLGIAGFALVGGGSALLLGLRRRQTQA